MKWRIKCHDRVMESVMNRVQQCINIDGRCLTGFDFKSNFVVMFLNDLKHLSFNLRYFELISIKCGRLA